MDTEEETNPSENTVLHTQGKTESSLQTATHSSDTHENKVDELAEINEEIKKARESLTQSWLDSRPLIDELEKLQLDLKRTKNRSSMATAVVPELENHLETTLAIIKSRKESELEARTTADQLARSVEQIREEMENLMLETDAQRRERTRLKQEFRLRRQCLRTVQLTLRAIRIESEALGASTAYALHHIKHSDSDNDTTVQLSPEEYQALMRRAREEVDLADWRVSVSMEQKQMAEASQGEALRRLRDIK